MPHFCFLTISAILKDLHTGEGQSPLFCCNSAMPPSCLSWGFPVSQEPHFIRQFGLLQNAWNSERIQPTVFWKSLNQVGLLSTHEQVNEVKNYDLYSAVKSMSYFLQVSATCFFATSNDASHNQSFIRNVLEALHPGITKLFYLSTGFYIYKQQKVCRFTMYLYIKMSTIFQF